ncbi:hypothetical protein HELRODRAFT_82846, partial [Helobdella robusta]|uniref:Coiled-coil domain-containing protein R3HCC1L n=1 Tax=Helobdella robusta TaxID=6412 RepID=T1G4X3_HELRO
EYGHLLEIYNFSREITTADLMMAFNKFHSQGFDIKWVDDTHAIAIFNSSTTATTALTSFHHPIIKLRCIDQATRQTKVKISKCSDFLLPYKERPVTVTHVVRNLVAGALGIRTNVSKEKREEEKKKIQEAREKRKADLKSRKDAWEGNL